ncbi:uncharacterized protein LOC112637258 [Camponotus floridanus]|uniref:uncharacterized protein LOC112637258 n=1 Tax=Camponotus floridanus TaxID=104421 RepID=UPI000DC6802A|nr:uncharacterized protein LOC112637258 [Camponotus floridanus]
MATPRSVECSVEGSWDKSHRRDLGAHARLTSSYPRDRSPQTRARMSFLAGRFFLGSSIPLLPTKYTLLRRYCTRADLSHDSSTLVECAAIGRDGRGRDASRVHLRNAPSPNAGVRMSRDSRACLAYLPPNQVVKHRSRGAALSVCRVSG